jgi:uncharacterized membrane protein
MFESLSFEPVVPWWTVAGFGLVVVVISCLRPGFGDLSVAKQRTLIGLRWLAALLLILAMIRPGFLSVESLKQRAVIPVMMDLSQSMQLPNAAQGESRYAVAQKVMARLQSFQDRLAAQDVELAWYGFDREVYAINSESQPAAEDPGDTATPPAAGNAAAATRGWPLQPEGKETDILGAIETVNRLNRNRRIAGYLMLTDGVPNVIRPQTTAAEVTRALAGRDAPFQGMIFGPSIVADDFIDAAVEVMPDNLAGFAENEVEFRAAVRLRGFNRQTVPVQLIVRTPDGEVSVAQTKQVAVTSGDHLAQVDFNYLPAEPGSYKLQVKIPDQPREVALTNNQLSAYLQAFPGGLRVLYITGDLQFEHHFLVRSLQASKDIQVRTVWLDATNRSRWPIDLTQEIKDRSYDVVVLDNIDATALHSERRSNLDALAESVLDGRGLLMMGGYHSFGPGGYAETPLAEVLPIRMSRTERQEFAAPLRTDMHLDKPLAMKPATDHYITRLGQGEGGAVSADWEALPKLRGANRFDRLKDSALVLLESQDRDPLLVAGNYGGRVLAFAGDSTYLWIRAGFDQQHQQFWRQLMLWLAARDVAGDERVWMRLSKRRVMAGDVLHAAAGVRGQGGDSVEGARITAILTGPEGQSRSIPFSMQADRTQFNGSLEPQFIAAAGAYRLEVRLEKDGAELGRESQEFDVVDIDSETVVPIADISLIQQVSEATEAAGGRIWTAQQVDALAESLLQASEKLEIKIPQLWRFGDTGTDAYGFVFALFFVMMLQWGLRKYWGLV